mgnify:CR=1 FL=1
MQLLFVEDLVHTRHHEQRHQRGVQQAADTHQRQSLKAPFIVMFTIPLAFTGGFLALLLSGIEVSVISLIGFVMLVGIIVNNGIVLVDYINQQRLAGMERREAIIDAGITRLRKEAAPPSDEAASFYSFVPFIILNPVGSPAPSRPHGGASFY